MALDLRMPNITGVTEREQLAQIRSYLYQIVPQLQYALSNIDTMSSSGYVVQQVTKKGETSNAPVSAEASFNAIKSLIIKSADIVEAYYDKISSRMSSSYRALSEFGEYVEKTEKLIIDTAEYSEDVYGKFKAIDEDLDGIPEMVRATVAFIKTGELVGSLSKDEAEKYGMKEGDTLYGVEVGQMNEDESGETTFKAFARFTANRLSFYDSSNAEVAYISNQKLYIESAEIVESLKRQIR